MTRPRNGMDPRTVRIDERTTRAAKTGLFEPGSRWIGSDEVRAAAAAEAAVREQRFAEARKSAGGSPVLPIDPAKSPRGRQIYAHGLTTCRRCGARSDFDCGHREAR